jgi:hypothetical protein
MSKHRYVLLCRHASHDGGELTPNKDEKEVWRFPTESVANVLAEEMVIGRDGLRLAKVVYASTSEASRTANLLLKGLNGERRKANDKPPAQPETLSGGNIRIAAPDWLPKADRKRCLRPGAYGYIVPHECWDELAPNRLDRTAEDALRRVDEEVGQLSDRNALLIVGHQPQMGWLSSYLVGRRWGLQGGAVPLAGSEVVCLRLRKKNSCWRGPLCWTLVPDDREALEAVSDKIKGKMESAKLLSAVITLVLSALLGVLLDASRWADLASPQASLLGWTYSGQAAVQFAFVLLLGALALYLLTMYSYDRLLMPTRFWAEGPDRRRGASSGGGSSGGAGPDARQGRRLQKTRWLGERRTSGAWLSRRPPSSSAWVAFRNMQRTWFWLFTPANILVGSALAILAAALLRVQDELWLPVAVFAVVLAAWGWWFRPVLGSED